MDWGFSTTSGICISNLRERLSKKGSLSPLLGKVEPVKGGCMYLEALKAILFVRILPPKRQTIAKGILVNKLCLTCRDMYVKHF